MRITISITLLLAVQGIFAQSIQKRYNLTVPLTEISGMTAWQNRYFAHGDGGSPAMVFELDANGKIIDTTTLLKPNSDWEDMATNATHFFIGDFGNNTGTRKDLKILKFSADSLGKHHVTPEVIAFNYQDQTDFTSNNFTNFDCEAMVATEDSLYLFSKSKSSGICRVYALPVTPGTYTARVIDTLQPPFWVTGAHLSQGQLWLCGYVPNLIFSLTPLICNYEYHSARAQRGSGKAYNLNYQGTRQVETICRSISGNILFSGEAYSGDSAAVFEITWPANTNKTLKPMGNGLVPNPAKDKIQLHNNKPGSYCGFYNTAGKLIGTIMPDQHGELNIQHLPGGIYSIEYQDEQGFKVLGRLLKL